MFDSFKKKQAFTLNTNACTGTKVRSTAGSDNKCTVYKIVVLFHLSPPVQKETYLEPDIWAAGMQVCVFCCYWHLLLLCSQKASGCSRASTVERCHMLITADPLSLLCKHVREECVRVCVYLHVLFIRLRHLQRSL